MTRFDEVFIHTIQVTFNETLQQAIGTYTRIVSIIGEKAQTTIRHYTHTVDLEASFALAWNLENFASIRIPRHRSARFCHFHRLLTFYITIHLYQLHCLQTYGNPSPNRINNTVRDSLIRVCIQDLRHIINNVDTYIREHTDADVDFNHVLNDNEMDPREQLDFVEDDDDEYDEDDDDDDTIEDDDDNEYDEGYTSCSESGSDSVGF